MRANRRIVTTTVAAFLAIATAIAQGPDAAPAIPINIDREAYYGDLHLHTSYSMDAYLVGALVGPDEAYRFAKGEVVSYLGRPIQRREPLDFLAVTDHAQNLGVFNELGDPNSPISQSDIGQALKADLARFTAPDGTRRYLRARGFPPSLMRYLQDYLLGAKNLLPERLAARSASAWTREIQAANQNYEPGKFTTFIAYEWTSMPGWANLHRNVIFKGNSAPLPFTPFDSQKPEDLWAWLERIRKEGYEALAIPHNGNFSKGLMYDWVDSYGKPIDQAYAKRRQTNEPLSEISQVKGTSETHPLLSPNDEFANFEISEIIDPTANEPPPRAAGSFLRDALSRGLALERKLGTNPYKYGFVGGSDLHSGISVSSQADYNGDYAVPNIGAGMPTQAQVASILGESDSPSPLLKTTSGNLTGVWAESNTRESIYAALRRKETFATSGTKLKLRFFGGWNFEKTLMQRKDWISTAYAKGVPMGSDLPPKPNGAKAPIFAIWAVKDPNGGNLDRVQVIKVWEEEGQQKEKVFDVIWAGSRTPNLETGRLPAVGDTVDLTTARYTNNIGAAELRVLWSDPDFDPHRFAGYYLRVLEIPTPRWSTLLAIRNGLPLPKDVPGTVQQRGWSSPIWFSASAQTGDALSQISGGSGRRGGHRLLRHEQRHACACRQMAQTRYFDRFGGCFSPSTREADDDMALRRRGAGLSSNGAVVARGLNSREHRISRRADLLRSTPK